MPSVNAFEINGVIDTNQNVLTNLNELCTASGCWLSYDVTTGLWSVVINRAGTSVKSFNDNNIIGSITISGTGIDEAYNKVSVEFPHKDLKDETDYIDLEIPAEDRYPNELDNTLNLRLNLTNDPVQAQYIATVELKQSRVDRVIQFRTDFTSLGLRAGDLIDVTASMYGFTNKMFRITKVVENDNDDGTLEVEITALEYDADVYDTSGLVRQERLKKTGITPKSVNTTVVANDNNATTTGVTNSLLDPTNAALIALLMSGLTRNSNSSELNGAVGVAPTVFTFKTSFLSAVYTNSTDDNMSLGYYKYVPLSGLYKIKYNVNWGGGANGSAGASGARKTSAISYSINGSAVQLNGDSATGDANVQIYEDHIIEGTLALNAGDRIDFGFTYSTNWPTAVFLVNAELILIQRV